MKYLLFVLFLIVSVFSTQLLAQVNDKYEQANIAFDSGQFDEAYIHLKNSLNEDPSHLPSKILMGKVLTLSFIYDDAISEFYEALSAGADPNLVSEYLANSLLVEGRFEEILTLSERGLSNKNRAFLYAAQAKAHAALEQSEDAYKRFDQALKLDNNNSAILDAYAKFYAQQDNLEKALELAREAVNASPDNSEALRTLANIYALLGDTNKFIETLENALGIDSDQPLVLRDLVSAYIRTNQLEKARSSLNSILETSPEEPMAKFLLSYVQRESGENEQAAQTLDELVSYLSLIDSDAMQRGEGLLFISAMANYATGNLEAARQDLLTYLNRQPNNFNANMLLSDIYAAEGSFASAIPLIEKFEKRVKSDLSLSQKLCDLYIRAKLVHKCALLVSQIESELSEQTAFVALKARSLAARGRPEQALKVLESVESEQLVIQLEKALLAIETNQLDKAMSITEKLVSQDASSVDFKNLLASIYIKQQQNQKARTILREILDLSPNHYSARFNYASVLMESGSINEARRMLGVLHTENPLQIDVMLMLTRLEKNAGNLEQAKTFIEKIFQLDRQHQATLIELIDILKIQGEYEEAVKLINPIIKDNFLSPEFIAQRAEIYIAAEKYESAKSDLNTLYGIYVDDAAALLDLSIIQRRARDLSGAIKSINRSLELAPNNYLAQLEKARTLINANDPNALDYIKTLEKQYGQTPDLSLLFGDLAMKDNNAQQASQYYQNALELDPRFNQAAIKRFQLALRGIEQEAFITFAKNAIQQDKGNDLLTNLLADLYLEKNEYDNALALYQQLIENEDYRLLPFVLNNLAYVYLQKEDFQQAYDAAQIAYNRLPTNQSILDTLGWALVKMGQFEQGLNYLRQSFAMNTADTAVRYHIAYALHQLGRTTEAKRELNNLLEQFGDFDYRGEAEALLANLP
uniref:XrtA/PEP-CTERM system TPR-repeat protein PrsT n=1 Tax=Ningiella ruwaisensis TaxID=2364274 RepID=UPI00109F47E3|nr:XrtA/PEP-CTERM system TPR-repeat protein PrsT [Ningiella ruwaisensis]